jgi:hypothetical protein
MQAMKLIIADALPPSPIALRLGDELAKRYPSLIKLFEARHASIQPWSVQTQGCTATQGLALQKAGFVASANQALGRALGQYLLDIPQSNEPAWVADMAGVIVAQDRTTLIGLSDLHLQPFEVEQLVQAAKPILGDSGDGIWLEPRDDGRWRVHSNFDTDAVLASPEVLTAEDLGDWWPTGQAWRGWRRRLNELQMIWHDHPVNLARQRAAAAPINSLWLYGGGGIVRGNPEAQSHWIDCLSASAQNNDWAQWLEDWGSVESHALQAEPDTPIILSGFDRIVHLKHEAKPWWQALLGKQSQSQWRVWWQPQQ